MDQQDLPLGFTFTLALNPEAMQTFSSLSKERQEEILQKARSVSSKREMKSLVNSLVTRE